MSKNILSIFISLLGIISLVSPVFGQSDQQIAKKYGISFPVSELGDCADIATCKVFCDQPINHQACSDFAQRHSLSSTSSTKDEKDEKEILKLAKLELGCTSYDACMAFCERGENMEKCMDFAARHNLMEDASQMKQQMSAVKNLLGCSSMKSCMDFCNTPANMQKCMEVFKQAGFPVEASYSGPGGCNSEESCRAYCERNPKECGGGDFQGEPPEVWCSRVASDCKWDGTTCTCGGTSSPQEPGEIWCPKAGPNCKWDGTRCNCFEPGECTKYPGCTWTGTECNCQLETNLQKQGDPAAECAKYGCTFDGKTCQCPTSDEKVDFSSQCLSQPGCSWDATNKTCSCSTQETSTAADNPSVVQGGETIYKSECLAASCRWSDDPKMCDCAGVGKDVQGASTSRNLLQEILDFILGR